MTTGILSKIISNDLISSDIYRIRLERTPDMGNIEAGQFFHIKSQDSGAFFLRRPISVCFTTDNEIHLVVRKSGKGTKVICEKRAGDSLDLLGPLGNGFRLADPDKKILLIGGGIGTAPLLELARQLENPHVKVLLGYRKDPYLVDEFQKYSKEVLVAVEEGERGYSGYVTDLLKQEIDHEQPDCIYACGPEVMLKKVQQLGLQYQIETQLALEERMACGVGACLVCSCKVKAEENGWHFVRTCKEGPVFSGSEVIFDE
ncbi:dihydroorotate dehydrogenase electron transfer subunit [Geosporobacter subterraneus DSM 17957]|uniref:Dihydroorotate dehydrogenase B (NAD(+)), electron transfer subunit n=1 Tax=Geosporobacter subterraneus DSM 17957 TaxID=1121919 RepID=A0A1M6LMM6_9FIRM|nr:dihydroorotate dehydrogenase electron transfer subunit [Geosporobacter subterraneus]SHJ72423.1 dihydroorotate dehydrogenase electron transfer subunit [Geosporobacter subterraneus DSM 17957]